MLNQSKGDEVTAALSGIEASAGLGWHALSMATTTYLHVDPEGDDYLPAAIETILSPLRQSFWTVEWSHEDEAGWDVYVILLTVDAGLQNPDLDIDRSAHLR